MKYLALDVGEKRIGVAATDDAGIIASPLTTLATEDRFMEHLGEIVASQRPDMIIVGLPRHANGDLSDMATQIKELAKGIGHEYNVPVDFEDESGTTVEAEARMKERGIPPKEIKEKVDAEAAAIILEGYLARKKSK